jgi:adenylylsulfate kinase
VLGALGTVQVLQSQGVGFLSDEQSLRAFRPEADDEEARFAEETINKHPLVAALRARADLHESRPHLKLPEDRRSLNLTAGTLMGPRRMAVPPYAWADAEGREFVSVMYAGDQMCGHAPFVHGGMLATILDEGLAFCCFKALPHGTAVTANLNVDYRKPARSPGFFVLRAETQRVEGRKAWVKGRIETLPTKPGEAPIVVAEATALYISPKYAAVRSSCFSSPFFSISTPD